MSEQRTGGFTNRLGLYFGLALLYFAFGLIMGSGDSISRATIGKLFTFLIGIPLGKVIEPPTWKPSLSAELIAIINPGFLTGALIGWNDIKKPEHLIRAVYPALLLLIPVALTLLIPNGVLVVLTIGASIVATLPYALLGGIAGWKFKQKRSSALTNG